MIRLLSLTFFLLALSSCSLLKKSIESPKVKVHEVNVEKMSEGKIWLDLILSVQNPNKIDFTVDHLEYVLEVNGKQVAAERQTQDIKIAAQQISYAKVPIQLKIEDVISSALILVTQKTLPFRARGNVKVGPFNIKFDENGQLDLKDL